MQNIPFYRKTPFPILRNRDLLPYHALAWPWHSQRFHFVVRVGATLQIERWMKTERWCRTRLITIFVYLFDTTSWSARDTVRLTGTVRISVRGRMIGPLRGSSSKTTSRHCTTLALHCHDTTNFRERLRTPRNDCETTSTRFRDISSASKNFEHGRPT